MNKQDILETISTNIDAVMNENVTIENLKSELIKRIFTNSLSLQNIVYLYLSKRGKIKWQKYYKSYGVITIHT